MPVISIWALVVSLIVLALGLVIRSLMKSHALKLADKEADRLRSRIETFEESISKWGQSKIKNLV